MGAKIMDLTLRSPAVVRLVSFSDIPAALQSRLRWKCWGAV